MKNSIKSLIKDLNYTFNHGFKLHKTDLHVFSLEKCLM